MYMCDWISEKGLIHTSNFSTLRMATITQLGVYLKLWIFAERHSYINSLKGIKFQLNIAS